MENNIDWLDLNVKLTKDKSNKIPQPFDCLVEVVCSYYKICDKILYEDYESAVWLKPLDETTFEFKRQQVESVSGEKHWVEDYDAIFTKDNVMFEFVPISLNTSIITGLSYEIDAVGEQEIFEYYLKDFYEYANKIKPKEVYEQVKILTAWNYRCYEEFNGESTEWSTDYSFEGFIDYNKLNLMLKDCLIKV